MNRPVQMNRRSFLLGATSAAALTPSGILADRAPAPVASAPLGKPDIRIGAVSDLHFDDNSDGAPFENALRYFHKNNVDAVVIAGDISEWGNVNQLQHAYKVWKEVFPDGKAADGRRVELMAVTGNHDLLGDAAADIASAWEKVFGEKYEPIWMKQVKGYTFIGAHWTQWQMWKGPDGTRGIEGFMRLYGGKADTKRPFFYIQHAHPYDTCIGKWAWGGDGGQATELFRNYPNCIALSGHSHYALTDERSVWQGEFTSLNTSSLRYMGTDYAMRENMDGNIHGYNRSSRKPITPRPDMRLSRQGLMLSLYGDRVVLERRDFLNDKPVGPDWRFSVPPKGDEMSFARRAALRSAPEFAEGAVPTVKLSEDKIAVEFPAAKSVKGCRVFEYEISAVLVEDDFDLVQAQRRVMAPDFHLPEDHEELGGLCNFRRDELPLKGRYIFRVRPIECFRRKGAEIVSDPVML